jgi:hypothetical protein
MYTTNPKKVTAPRVNSGVTKVDNLLKFNDIEYPDLDKGLLDKGFLASPSPASSANTSIEKTNGGHIYPPSNDPILPSNGSLYPSTKDLSKNAAMFSGALSFSKVPNNNQSKL